MNKEIIHLKLTVAEVNKILEGLGQQPYIKVVELIQKIQQQGDAQLKSDEANDFVKNEEKSKIAVKNGK